MNFADYLYNMTDEDFEDAQIIANLVGDLPKNDELRLRIEALKKALNIAVGDKQ